MTTMSAKQAMSAIILASVILTGCAARPSVEAASASNYEAIAGDGQDLGRTVVRKSAMAAQAGVLYARSVHIDPINRPVSNFLSLSSYVLNSTTGLFRRAALGTVQFPALERQPVPELAYAAPMDLYRWEKDLDRISGRKQMKGTIKFLIDGEEYFERMLQAVAQAEESIDIRTYIFDNDDYAVEVADILKEKANEDRKSTRLNYSHSSVSRMPSSA